MTLPPHAGPKGKPGRLYPGRSGVSHKEVKVGGEQIVAGTLFPTKEEYGTGCRSCMCCGSKH